MKIIVLATYTKSLLNFRVPMMRALVEKGWEVVAVGPGDDAYWRPRFEAHGVRWRSIFLNRNGLNPFADLRTCRELKRLFEEEKPDRLFCSQAKAVVYGVPAARKAGVQGVYALISGLGSIFHGKGLKNALVRMVLQRQYRRALRLADGVFFQNEDDRRTFLERSLVAADKTTLIPGSGVDVRKFTPTPLPASPVFLMLTRLLRDKGVVEFLQAARLVKAHCPQSRFLLAGPYDTNPSALKPADLQPCFDDGTVEYLGELEDVRPALAQAAVFVFPSYHEGTPMCVLEALASGRAVVTTDAVGCRETVREGENGFLVPVGTVEPLAATMERFVREPELAARMGAAGRRLAESRFAAEHVNEILFRQMKISPQNTQNTQNF